MNLLFQIIILTMGEEDRQLKYINVGMEFTSKVARKILDNLEGEEQAEQLDIMRTVMKECVTECHRHYEGMALFYTRKY